MFTDLIGMFCRLTDPTTTWHWTFFICNLVLKNQDENVKALRPATGL